MLFNQFNIISRVSNSKTATTKLTQENVEQGDMQEKGEEPIRYDIPILNPLLADAINRHHQYHHHQKKSNYLFNDELNRFDTTFTEIHTLRSTHRTDKNHLTSEQQRGWRHSIHSLSLSLRSR